MSQAHATLSRLPSHIIWWAVYRLTDLLIALLNLTARCLGSKGLKFALFHHLYTFPEGYKGFHRLAHRISSGWYSIELGNWALEVETSDRTDRFLVKQWGRLQALR